MTSNLSWVTTIFCPVVGSIINNAKGAVPVMALLDARKKKKLGASAEEWSGVNSKITEQIPQTAFDLSNAPPHV